MSRFKLYQEINMKMVNLIKTVGLISVMSLSTSPLLAAGDHAHGPDGSHKHAPAKKISEKEAGSIAKEVVAELVKNKKLKAPWLKVAVATTAKKKFKQEEEWVLTLKNDKAEKGKQTLYVFLSLTGEYLGANFTGQ